VDAFCVEGKIENAKKLLEREDGVSTQL